MHTGPMAETGRSRHTLGMSMAVTVFLCLKDQTWVPEPKCPGRGTSPGIRVECRLPGAVRPGVNILSAGPADCMEVAIVPVMSKLHGCHFHVFVCVAATDRPVWWHFDTESFFFFFF